MFFSFNIIVIFENTNNSNSNYFLFVALVLLLLLRLFLVFVYYHVFDIIGATTHTDITIMGVCFGAAWPKPGDLDLWYIDCHQLAAAKHFCGAT